MFLFSHHAPTLCGLFFACAHPLAISTDSRSLAFTANWGNVMMKSKTWDLAGDCRDGTRSSRGCRFAVEVEMREVSELQGPELDYWVARAEIRNGAIAPSWWPMIDHCGCLLKDRFSDQQQPYAPSSDWAIGGPIIERVGIDLFYYGRYWEADYHHLPDQSKAELAGNNLLLAAMRCYVQVVFGEQVEDVNPTDRRGAIAAQTGAPLLIQCDSVDAWL